MIDSCAQRASTCLPPGPASWVEEAPAPLGFPFRAKHLVKGPVVANRVRLTVVAALALHHPRCPRPLARLGDPGRGRGPHPGGRPGACRGLPAAGDPGLPGPPDRALTARTPPAVGAAGL